MPMLRSVVIGLILSVTSFTLGQDPLIDPRGCMYSCLTVLENGEIGLLYEVAGTLSFARFSLDWALKSK